MNVEQYIKSSDAIAKMRVASRMVADVLVMIEPHVQPGVSTGVLNDICHDYIVNELQAYPASNPHNSSEIPLVSPQPSP